MSGHGIVIVLAVLLLGGLIVVMIIFTAMRRAMTTPAPHALDVDLEPPASPDPDSTETPWGSAVRVYATTDDFYADRPELLWPFAIPGNAPQGSDLAWITKPNYGPQWMAIYAHREAGFTSPAGAPLVAYEHATGKCYVVAEAVDLDEAKRIVAERTDV